MPEFVTVTFPQRRRVFMDSQPMGFTGEMLTVETGFHDFDLGAPPDYAPPSHTVNVANTQPPRPMIVAFTPTMMEMAAPSAAPPAPPPAPPHAAAAPARKAKAARKKAAKKK